jgi:transcriptional regulator with XRE-family HTH domain
LDKDGGEPDGAENEAEVMQLIGDKVRKYRRQKGLSQEQLGEIVGFSQSKISKIENEDWDSLSDLRLIAKALEAKIEELITDRSDEVEK